MREFTSFLTATSPSFSTVSYVMEKWARSLVVSPLFCHCVCQFPLSHEGRSGPDSANGLEEGAHIYRPRMPAILVRP